MSFARKQARRQARKNAVNHGADGASYFIVVTKLTNGELQSLRFHSAAPFSHADLCDEDTRGQLIVMGLGTAGLTPNDLDPLYDTMFMFFATEEACIRAYQTEVLPMLLGPGARPGVGVAVGEA